VQLFGSALLIVAAGVAAGVDWRLAVVAGLGLGMSSTAIGLSVLNERNLMATGAGQSVLSVALLQDIAAIPILAIVPLLALQGAAAGDDGNGWIEGGKALGVIVAIILAAGCCCALRCAGSHAATRPRSSPPLRCCWWWPPPR
jgi:glutathione-regulated potassium-efflux system ancillary protein KefC